jgi:hypothetical protein
VLLLGATVGLRTVSVEEDLGSGWHCSEAREEGRKAGEVPPRDPAGLSARFARGGKRRTGRRGEESGDRDDDSGGGGIARDQRGGRGEKKAMENGNGCSRCRSRRIDMKGYAAMAQYYDSRLAEVEKEGGKFATDIDAEKGTRETSISSRRR